MKKKIGRTSRCFKGICTFVLTLAAGIAIASAATTAPVIPSEDAMRVFAEAGALCKSDDGRLWGVSLCVPMMFVDPNTREAVTNESLPGATRDGELFRLTLPADAQISDTPTEYGGVHLAEIMWPIHASADMRAVTLMHESFHIMQPKLGFNGYAGMGSISGNAFLDTQAGRIWLRGELHALRTALQTNGAARKRALQDALALRRYRDSLFPAAAEQEREQDIMEGLAEGTGIDAGLPPNRRIAYALYDIAFVESASSYARAFPYATGPAYSELLDAVEPGWRRAVTPSSDISMMALRAYGLRGTMPSASQAHVIIARYGGATIESEEAARATRKMAMDATFTRELVTGSTIALPMIKFKITFNPRDIESLAPHGSVYHTLHVTASWGAITVSGGDALISSDFGTLTVAAPPSVSGGVVEGQGWTLDLAPGYAIVPDPERSGSYTVSAQH